MPKRWCSDQPCNVLVDAPATRCDEHEVAAQQRAAQRRARATAGRPSATARGYGAYEQGRARAIVIQARRDGLPCGICGEPCLEDQVLVAHHPDSDAGTGDPRTVRLVAAHKRCNDGFRPGRRG